MVDEIIEFTNFYKSEPTLFRVYADFECINHEISEARGENAERIGKHIPRSYTWTLVSGHPDVPNRVEYFPEEKQEDDFIEKNEDENMTAGKRKRKEKTKDRKRQRKERQQERHNSEEMEERGKEVIDRFMSSLQELEELFPTSKK